VADESETTLNEKDLAKHIPIIRNYLRKIVRPDEIEDATQTTLARALENLDRFRGESSPRVWLLGIARNVGYEIGRARQRGPLLSGGEEGDEGAPPDPSLDPPAPTQEDILVKRRELALALTAIDGLSLDEKLALLVTYVDGLPGPEAAEVLGVSFAAFRQRLSRARQAMNRELERLESKGRPLRVHDEVLRQWSPLLHPQKKSEED